MILNNKIQKAKDFLENYKFLEIQEKYLKNQKENLENEFFKNEIDKELKKIFNQKEKIRELINKIKPTKEKKLLFNNYIEGKKILDLSICKDISTRQLFNIKRKALLLFYELIQELIQDE